MKVRRPWFKFYPGDWLSARRVALMTPAQKGVYIDLLCICWQEGQIPSDADELAYLLRLPRKVFFPLWEVVKHHFSTGSDDRFLVNSRIEAERASAEKRSEKNRKAAESRWADDANALQTDNECSAQTDAIEKEKQKEREKENSPAGARVISPGPTWGKKQLYDLWIEVVQKTPSGNSYLLDTLADRIASSARARRVTDVAAHGERLLQSFVAVVDGWRDAKRPRPQKSVEAFEKHFAAAEEVVDGERDPRAIAVQGRAKGDSDTGSARRLAERAREREEAGT